MAIAGLIMGAVGSAFYYLMVVPPEQSDRLTAVNELRFALDRIQHDGVQSQSFILGPDPYVYYGYFYSEDYQCNPNDCLTSNVSYKYDDGKLVRVETRVETIGSTPTTTTTNMTLSSHIVNFGDVSFEHPGNNTVVVTMTVIMNPGTANEISKTDTRYIDMRAWNESS